jgi:hypothetical protein
MEMILDNDYPESKRKGPDGPVNITPAPEWSESEDETPAPKPTPKKKKWWQRETKRSSGKNQFEVVFDDLFKNAFGKKKKKQAKKGVKDEDTIIDPPKPVKKKGTWE